jgi:NADH-quinone oxidoreductase subunit J
VPALLPDGAIAPESLAEIIDRTEVAPPPQPAPDDAHALTGRSDRSGRPAPDRNGSRADLAEGADR